MFMISKIKTFLRESNINYNEKSMEIFHNNISQIQFTIKKFFKKDYNFFFIDSNDIQLLNASSPIEVTLSGIFIDFNDVQTQNTPFSITVTPLGTSIDFNDVQLLNASSPIEVTLLGISIDFNDVQ